MVDDIGVKKTTSVYSSRPVKRNTSRDQALENKKPPTPRRKKPSDKGQPGHHIDDYA